MSHGYFSGDAVSGIFNLTAGSKCQMPTITKQLIDLVRPAMSYQPLTERGIATNSDRQAGKICKIWHDTDHFRIQYRWMLAVWLSRIQQKQKKWMNINPDFAVATMKKNKNLTCWKAEAKISVWFKASEKAVCCCCYSIVLSFVVFWCDSNMSLWKCFTCVYMPQQSVSFQHYIAHMQWFSKSRIIYQGFCDEDEMFMYNARSCACVDQHRNYSCYKFIFSSMVYTNKQ